MSDKIKAADDIRNMARMYKNMQSVADQLESIGQMEQVAAESKRAVDAAKADLASINVEIETAETRLASLDAQAEQRAFQSNAVVTKMLSDADEQAHRIQKDAILEADRIMSEAKTVADQIKSDADAVKNEANQLIVNANASLSAINSEVETRKAELIKLNAVIEKSRAQIKSLMGE